MNAFIETELRSGVREARRREVEELLIGSIVIEPARIDEVSQIVEARDFSDTSLGKLFALVVAMREAHKSVGPKAVLLEAKKTAIWEDLGGAAGIGKIINQVVNAADYLHYPGRWRGSRHCIAHRSLRTFLQPTWPGRIASRDALLIP